MITYFSKYSWEAEFRTIQVPICSVPLLWGQLRNVLEGIVSIFASLRAVSNVRWRGRACGASVVSVKQRFSRCRHCSRILWYSTREPNKRNLAFEKCRLWRQEELSHVTSDC